MASYIIWQSATSCFSANARRMVAFSLGVVFPTAMKSIMWNPFQAIARKLSVPVSARSHVIHLSPLICGSLDITDKAASIGIGASKFCFVDTFQLPSKSCCAFAPPDIATAPT